MKCFAFLYFILFTSSFSLALDLTLNNDVTCNAQNIDYEMSIVDVKWNDFDCSDVANSLSSGSEFVEVTRSVKLTMRALSTLDVSETNKYFCDEETKKDFFYVKDDHVLRRTRNCTAITKIDIDDLTFSTPIESIAGGTFSNLPNLSYLKITNTKLKNLNFLSEKMISLKRINLSDNEITGFPQGFTFDLPNLKFVTLNNNQIGNLPNSLFGPKIRKIGFSGNKISHLGTQIFSNTGTVITLDDTPSSLNLYNNLLTHLPVGIFANVQTGNINLGKNQLSEIDFGIFYSQSDAEVSLKLEDNPISCCGLRGLEDLYWGNETQNRVFEYDCTFYDRNTTFAINYTNPFVEFECCLEDDYYNQENQQCESCFYPDNCAIGLVENITDNCDLNGVYDCSQCQEGFWVDSENPKTCQRCEAQNGCLSDDEECIVPNGTMQQQMKCQRCQPHFSLDENLGICVACTTPNPSCIDVDVTQCVNDTTILQCLACEAPYILNIDLGICEQYSQSPTDNHVSIIVGSVIGAVIAIVTIICIACLIFWKKFKSWSAKQSLRSEDEDLLDGMTPLEFVLLQDRHKSSVDIYAEEFQGSENNCEYTACDEPPERHYSSASTIRDSVGYDIPPQRPMLPSHNDEERSPLYNTPQTSTSASNAYSNPQNILIKNPSNKSIESEQDCQALLDDNVYSLPQNCVSGQPEQTPDDVGEDYDQL